MTSDSPRQIDSSGATPPAPVCCVKCGGPGSPYLVETIPQTQRVRVAVRCSVCAHRWQVQHKVDGYQPR